MFSSVSDPDTMAISGPTQTAPDQLYSIAATNVQNEHDARLDGYDNDFTTGVYDVLGRCAADGRGPEMESDGPSPQPDLDQEPSQ